MRYISLMAGVVLGAGAFATLTLASQPNDTSRSVQETAFLVENDTAMNRMMIDMAIKPTGGVDRDFVGMMVPHHQGALDMAVVYLRYGNNQVLRRLAQEIIITQQQEISAMRLAVGENLPASTPSPTQVSPATPDGSMSMHSN